MGRCINEQIRKLAEKIEAYTINMRRQIHTYAELGGKEYKTSELVCKELEKLGIPYEKITDTAIIGRLDSGKPGATIALRADMDALPIQENPNNLAGKRRCHSEQLETAHACGHDAHTAMLLGSIQVLNQFKDQLKGSVLFCFESGEECGASVQEMIAHLKEIKPDTVWAIHVYSALDSGEISVDLGPRMAGAAGVNIKVHGRGGHGSRPDKSINPVYAAANIVTNIPGAFVNQLDAEETVTFGITTIKGGGVGNIFPDFAEIAGSLRFFNAIEGDKAVEIIKKVATHTAAFNDCRVEFGDEMRILIEPVMNDERCARLAAKAISSIYPGKMALSQEPWYASESFARYTREFPGVMAFLGIRNRAYGSGAEHHNELFDVDEGVLKIGVGATVGYVMNYEEATE